MEGSRTGAAVRGATRGHRETAMRHVCPTRPSPAVSPCCNIRPAAPLLRAEGAEADMIQLPIKRTVDRIPGGMMIVPLFIGALFKTFLPGTPQFFGSFTGALFNAPLTILAVFYVCMGATIEFKATPYILKKGGALFAAKV